MKFAIATLIGAAAAQAENKDIEFKFTNWISAHGKSYATKDEYNFRLGVFERKMNYIEEHNA